MTVRLFRHEPAPPRRPGPYPRQRLATYEVNLYVPADLPADQLDLIVKLVNRIDVRARVDELVAYLLERSPQLNPVTKEVDE